MKNDKTPKAKQLKCTCGSTEFYALESTSNKLIFDDDEGKYFVKPKSTDVEITCSGCGKYHDPDKFNIIFTF